MNEKKKRDSATSTKKTKSLHTAGMVVTPEKPPTAELPSTVELVQRFFGEKPVAFVLNIKASSSSTAIRVIQESQNTAVSMGFQLPPILQQVFRLRAEAGHRANDCLVSQYYNSYDRFTRALAQMGYSVTEETKEACRRWSSPFDLTAFNPFFYSGNSEKARYCVGVGVAANEVSDLASTLRRIETDLPTVQVLFNALCDDVIKATTRE